MKVIKNEKLIKRNAKIGQYTSLAALAVLGVGMYISIKRPDLFFYAVLSLIAGFTMTQIGMSFTNRWGRSPRPDEQLDAALKGLPGDTVLYHYVTPVGHVLVGPAGLWILETRHQKGKVTYSRGRWRLSGGGFMQAYMSIFGQEGIGRPDVDIEHDTNALKSYLAKNMEENEIPEIQSALVFTNDEAELDAADAPAPTLKAKQLKDFLRQRAKERSLGPLIVEQVKTVLTPAELPAS